MNKSLIFFDIDDTLIPFRQGIREDVRRTLDQLKVNGHYVFINTGRTSASLPPDVRNYDFDGIAAGCGTEIFINKKNVFSVELEYEDLQRFYKDIENYGCEALLEGRAGVAFVGNKNSEFIQGANALYIKEQVPIYDWTSRDFDLKKLCLIFNENSRIEELKEKYSDYMEFMLREDGKNPFYELSPLGYSKATAMSWIADYLKVDPENIYAFGDSGNDLAMLQAARHSVAMGNAVDRIKEVCEFVTHNCTEDGIEFACRHYGLI